MDQQNPFHSATCPEGLTEGPAPGAEIGKTRWEIPYLEPDAETWRKHREILDAHLPFRDFELARPTRDGGKRYVSVAGLPVFDKSGNFVGYRGVGRHITARKKIEEALRRSEAYLAEAQRLSHTGTVAFSAAGLLYWSEETYRIWQFDPLQGLPSREMVLQRMHPDDRERVNLEIDEALREKRTFSLAFRIVFPDRTGKYIESTGGPLFSADGKLVEMVATHVDVTERIRAEHALNVAQAELSHMSRLTTMGELTASIAHEVKQPLTGIVSSGHASLRYLDADPQDIGSARRAVERIIKDAFRASDVIGRIRAMAKKSPEARKTLNLNEMILETLGLVSTELQRSNVLARTELSNDIPLVLADQVQLQQVVLNLVINAKDAMTAVEEGPRELSIGTEENSPDQILVSVRDSGPALDQAKVEDMFKAFHTTKAKGMGLGLTISRSIIEAHGGQLWAMPNEPHGAIFQFTIPVSREVQEP